jgi:(R)-2-hydroxyacyl-CoA dehydratese activating ATPase
MIIAGCDVGSTTGKVIIMEDNEITGTSIIPSGTVCEQTARNAMDIALKEAGITLENIEYCVGTGYGRVNIPFATKNITEISCHGRGAHWVNNKIHTVIDIGGQDCKVIRVDDTGTVKDFVMNDKCAAGTGRFLEAMCKILHIKIEDLGPLSLDGKEMLEVSSQCSVFAEAEIVSLMAEKKPNADICAGINNSVANRLVSMLYRVGMEEEIVISGGVSKNIGVVKMIEDKVGLKLYSSPAVDPQLFGALGAALFAKRALERQKK